MIKLFSKEEFLMAKSRDLLPLKCKVCSKVFLRAKHRIVDFQAGGDPADHCSRQCEAVGRTKDPVKTKCDTCQKPIEYRPCDFKRSIRHFCSHRCSAIYSNSHKTHGTKRSKLECWLEKGLLQRYPSLEFHFNRSDAIGSELDIYIPSLSLAFEMNGIYHYEPIFGCEKLASTQKNDQRKFQKCQAQGISLCIIDVSREKYFKEDRAVPYLQIITDIIDANLAGKTGVAPAISDSTDRRLASSPSCP